MDTTTSNTSSSNAGIPVIPLPNVGEGGPLPTFSNNSNDNTSSDSIPVIPLPNVGEGGALPTFPNINMNGSGSSHNHSNNNSNSGSNSIWGTIVTMFPRSITPCYFCNTTQYGTVRFLNAAANYNPFLIYINEQLVVNSLDNAEISQYGRVSSGTQSITVSGQNGYVYLQKSIQVRSGSAMTVAIINTASGLDIMSIYDSACFAASNNGCFRVCNLSYTNQKVNVSLNSGFLTFRNVAYKEVTNFSVLSSGVYTLQVNNSASIVPLVTSSLSIRERTSYTAYVFNWNLSTDAIRTLIVEDRR